MIIFVTPESGVIFSTELTLFAEYLKISLWNEKNVILVWTAERTGQHEEQASIPGSEDPKQGE